MSQTAHHLQDLSQFGGASNADSVLNVVVGDKKLSIPLGLVCHLDVSTRLSTLPFTTFPIKGLSRFDNRPVVHFSLAGLLGLPETPGGKSVVLATPHGEISLGVDDILGFQPAGKVRSATDRLLVPGADSLTTLPLLNLAEILPWLAELSNRKSPPATESLKAAPPPAVVHPLTVLEVASGEEMITLLADGIDYVEEIDDMCSTGQGTDGVVRLADRLFPAYSLARLRGLSTSLNERQAVIVRTAQGAWALTVERVLGLKQIDHFQSIPSGGKTSSGAPSQPPGIWYLTETLQMRQLFDPNVLIGQSGEQKQDMQMPAGEPPFSILSEQLGSEGLRVQCGECTFILPVVLTQRVMDNLSPAMKCQPTPGQQRDYRVPFLDGTLLTSGRLRHQPANINIRLALSARRSVVLAVDRIALQATLPAERWFPLPPLPSPASLFFDAAAYDVEQEQWMLRVRSDSSKVQWSHLIRQSAWAEKVSLALLGWLDSTLLDEKED